MPKILLSDDDVQLCNVIKGWLLLDNHNVEMVHNGKDALERLKISEYDLVVLDITMPMMSGMEVLSSFRADGGVTPVLMLTGQDTIQDKERGFDAGADDYFDETVSWQRADGENQGFAEKTSGIHRKCSYFCLSLSRSQ